MTQTPPDRLSNNPKSPHYDPSVLEKGVGVRFNGVEKTTVEEYCVSEGWVRLAVGKTLDRHGAPLTIKLRGSVEPYFQTDQPEAWCSIAWRGLAWTSMRIAMISVAFFSFFVPTTWLQLALCSIVQRPNSGSDRAYTGHSFPMVDPVLVTRTGRRLRTAAAERISHRTACRRLLTAHGRDAYVMLPWRQRHQAKTVDGSYCLLSTGSIFVTT
jgi:hypothetical protein